MNILKKMFPGLFQTKDNNMSEWNRVQNEILTDELKNVIMQRTLETLKRYIFKSELKDTGLWLKPEELEKKVQQVFWEFKEEKLIDDWNCFNKETQKWILFYS